ncbi:MAG: hypothetical protein ACI8QS_002044 [Planctomycetota bacterium]|jgi:hypothetical protein
MKLSHHGGVQLCVRGSWRQPDAAGLCLARDLEDRYENLKPSIEAALFDVCDCHDENEQGSVIATPGQVWDHVRVDRVLIEPLDGQLTIEIAYESDWDPEHRLGARIRDWRLIEFNGSV